VFLSQQLLALRGRDMAVTDSGQGFFRNGGRLGTWPLPSHAGHSRNAAFSFI
jgi:hypothetical protein